MKRLTLICLVLFFAVGLFARWYCMPARVVNLGIDVLEANNFDILEGKRVGLITNHTGFNNMGISTIDILHGADNFELVKLFSPEHGIRGDLDTRVGDEVDEKTGLSVISLYGETRRPQEKDLKELDVLVFDIQGIGTRFYTYKWTMAMAMEECAKYGVEFVVLDRPNPINGIDVQGAVAHEEVTGGFTAYFPIATRHGMTYGELAKMCNEHFGIGADLTVVKMENWERWMYYDQTGLPWRNPSPNMKTLWGALFYPGLGVGETTLISMGRGTDIPFEVFGAPFIDGHRLARVMNRISDKVAIRFIPTEFTPTAPWHDFEGQKCYGVRAILLDRKKADPVLAGLYLFQHLYFFYPEDYGFKGGFKTSSGDIHLEAKIKRGMPPEDIVQTWQRELREFKRIREQFLLY